MNTDNSKQQEQVEKKETRNNTRIHEALGIKDDREELIDIEVKVLKLRTKNKSEAFEKIEAGLDIDLNPREKLYACYLFGCAVGRESAEASSRMSGLLGAFSGFSR